jgi:multisubunit Na+/H+ antiporter MnhB subunit
MDKITAILTGFIILCVSLVVCISLWKPGAESVVNTYLAGAFGIVSGGSIALPVGYAIGKNKSETIKQDIEEKLNAETKP